MSTPTIRPLKASDRSGWDGLWNGYLDFYETSLAPEVTEGAWRRLIASEGDLRGLIAESDGRLIGFAHYLLHPSTWALQNYCYLEDLFVSETVRGGGIGRALIAAVEDAARKAGATRLCWVTHIENAKARKLYDQLADYNGFIQYRKQL
jgi:GNAT superfamily N-acetyltransferase